MVRIRQCLILAAGNGTRLRKISSDLPKPLVQFQGRPILEHDPRLGGEALERQGAHHPGGESGLSQKQRGVCLKSQKRTSR